MLFRIQPMQIDTRNRDPKYINDTVFRSSILPKSSAAPFNASYSGLLECPCTTRINKTYKKQLKQTKHLQVLHLNHLILDLF